MRIEEKILIKKLKKQDKEVFEALFFEYYPMLTQFAESYVHDRQTSEDIVQSYFIYFWENSKTINITTSFKSYFFQSIKNRCLNHLRNLQIHDKHNLLYIENCLESNNEGWVNPGFSAKVENAISKLPRGMCEILKQKYLHEKEIKEIAEYFKIKETTVKTQLFRAKGKLKMMLQK